MFPCSSASPRSDGTLTRTAVRARGKLPLLLKQATCLTSAGAAALLLAHPAAAQMTVSDDDATTPLVTSSAGDITVAEDAVLTVDSGAAITVNSDNDVTTEDDATISVGDADGASAITIQPGTDSTIVNDGDIEVLEDYVPTDADSNSIADGAIASASDRYGIHVASGGTASGSITNSGTITVEGLNSYGIVVDSDYTGDIVNDGTIYTIGDYSTGLHTQSVDGNVEANGTIQVVGEGAQGVVIDGDVSGTFSVQGTVTQSLSYIDDDSATIYLSRSDLAVSAPAVEVTGNVDGGIIIAAPPYDLDDDVDDEDGDGVDDDDEATGAIYSYGASPALQIGGEDDIAIGTVTGREGDFSLAVDGTVSASANKSSLDAHAIVIGGQGGDVDMADGIGVTGTVTATTVDSEAIGLLINQGSNVPYLYNSGAISASISSPGGGTVYAVQDLSNTLTQIDNTGTISVSASIEDTSAAIDLSANTTGVTINQYLNSIDQESFDEELEDDDYDADTATTYTAISGDILTGSGDDVLNIQAGRIAGDTYLAAGDDTVSLSGYSGYDGDIYFGTGNATMALSDYAYFNGTADFGDESATLSVAGDASFLGAITGGSNLDVTVSGGTFGGSSATTSSVNSITVGSDASYHVYIDGDSGTASKIIANTATFEDGSTVTATIESLTDAEGSYTILTADTLNGSPTFSDTASLPVLYTGSVTTDDNDVVLTISRKTAEQLGLTASQSAGFDAIIAAASEDDDLTASLLQVDDVEALQGQFDQLLPDHAGGVFDVVRRGTKLADRHITDTNADFDISDVGGWIEPFYFHDKKDENATAPYTASGWGISTGVEKRTGIGFIGLSLSYTSGSVSTGDWQDVDVSQLGANLFWRKASGPLYTFAKIGAGRVSMSSDRTFTGEVDDADITYSTDGDWKGWSASASAGAAYTAALGSNFSLKPQVTLDYLRLHENGYTEDGDDDVIDLAVESRNSDSLSAETTLTLAWSTGYVTHDYRPLTFELEGGRRNQISGDLGSTTAYFDDSDGDAFTIDPTSLKSGWLAKARIVQGGLDYMWQINGGWEQTQSGTGFSFGGALTVAF
ncbi:autotransporter outer membrane beta-barrel domain-containing protein [Stakelama sp. CBK3Z-3]|uniref:Autotransporter outer membrane beta-barrel domain-containing protein n=1 Tax=Stakelama flava TaxID=2860338 RepID=A0ABS6XK20_9SPHN|nr:autotransporter outer membrane beta-barrel domain-containing protein [Stakelama flava]MBW4330547.1 autotransporter outer membrane beta-barrel domain-containing protein [Stakelama flava]